MNYKKNKTRIVVFGMVMIFMVGIGLGGYFTNRSLSLRNNAIKNSSFDLNPENWNLYEDSTYKFRYPSDWTVQPGTVDEEKNYWFSKDYVEIVAPSLAVTINIAPSKFIYGFESIPDKQTSENLKVFVNGKEYNQIENIRIEAGVTKVFVDMPVFVSGNEYHILFGTGYPVNQDNRAQFSEYQKYKQTILKILSTLEIKE